MSTTTISWNFDIGGVPADVTSAVFSDPTGTYGVRRIDTLAVVVVDGTALNYDGVGAYSYTFTDPETALTYSCWIEFIYLGNTYRIEQNIPGGTGVLVRVQPPRIRSMSAMFQRVATETVSVKAAPAFVSGQRGNAVVIAGLENLKATHPQPVDAQTRARVAPDTAHLIYETFIEGDYDIRNGDLLTWNGADYPIRQCEPWTWHSIPRFRLYIEELT